MYPDTIRLVCAGIESVERALAANMRFMHTTNNPAHTLVNGLIIPQENTNTRTRDHGQARGRRSSSIRIQCYVRLNEIPIWLKSAIGAQTSSAFPDNTTQVLTKTGTPTGGTMKFSYGEDETTALAYNATGATLQTAFEALPSLGVGEVTVSGSAGGPWTVAFPNLDPGFPNGILGPYELVLSNNGLTGGTNPSVTIVPGTVSGAYLHRFLGGVQRGLPLSLWFFNGLYWRQMLGSRVNTMNIQGMGNGLALLDLELIGAASTRLVSAPSVPAEITTYPPIDAPMQSVYVDGTIESDMDRFSVLISNNLTMRSTMDGSTSAGRTRFGDFTAEIDAMVDYPQYPGSLYEAFELNSAVGAMDLVMLDDLDVIGASTVNPYLRVRLPKPVLQDTSEGDDGGETVQMVKGKGQYDPTEAATVVVDVVSGIIGTYYDPS